VLILRRIHVRYRLVAPQSQREVVERVHSVHRRFCPVYRSLHPQIEITTSYELARAEPPDG
jgi:uncharacterized OsmC-like protein